MTEYKNPIDFATLIRRKDVGSDAIDLLKQMMVIGDYG